jgi:FixJ family two-component response regulator
MLASAGTLIHDVMRGQIAHRRSSDACKASLMARGPTVAIVDDDEAVRIAMASLIRSNGYAARSYASASEFLIEAVNELPDCLIADVQMPVMNGIELQQHLVSSGRRVPTIFITAFRDEATRKKILAAGAFCFFYKPFDANAMLRSIQEAVDHSSNLGN